MPGASLCTLLLGFLLAQDPPSTLQRGLDNTEPAVRRAAAQEIAALGDGVDDWLEDEFGRGAPLRQRSLLLAAALLGSERSLELVDRAARRGRRPDSRRAWSLMLYGYAHPEAGLNARDDWRRATTDFEHCCLLVGLIGAPHPVDMAGLREQAGRRPGERVAALLNALEAVQGGQPTWSGESAVEVSGQILCSLLAGSERVPADRLTAFPGKMSEDWRLAALRDPGRSGDSLRGTPLGGNNAVVAFVLHELEPSLRQKAFDFLRDRLREPPAAAWLWGSAGDLSLDLGAAGTAASLTGEAAGLLRLAITAPDSAIAAAVRRLPLARKVLEQEGRNEDRRWAAALILALAGASEDHAWFKQELELAPPAWRQRLQPVWLLASGSLDQASVRQAWLSRWSRALGAGRIGFLDQEAPRWMAMILINGTIAAEERVELDGIPEGMAGAPDHPITDELYADMAEFLFSATYRWNLD